MVNITHVAAGTGVATTTTSLSLVAPTVIEGDIMLTFITANDNVAVVPPATWALIRADNNTSAMRTSCYWKRAAAADSGATFVFTVAGTTVAFGVIDAWRGCLRGGKPIGNTTVSANASSDTVTYATLTPQQSYGAVVAFGAYNLNATTAGAISGTDPAFTNTVDIETATGNTASIFVYWDVSSGAATGARSHATTSTVDAINTGTLIELLTQNNPGGPSGGGDGYVTYPRVIRPRTTRPSRIQPS